MAVLLAIATAAFLAASLRLPSLLSTLLAAYLAFVANVGLVTWALTPVDAVTPTWLAVAELALLAAAVAVWWLRGRPLPPGAAARAALGRAAADPVTLLFLAVAGVALAYELVLALTVPPNNWDSLTYHLARVAAWHQEDGIHWIPNAPTDRLNEFQPLAEQQILFLVVATGSTALFALPQYLAQLAILAAVYGTARRLGFDVRPAACASALLATFSLMLLEATTAQNDLVAASFPIVSAYFLLGVVPLEAILAGASLGLGLGAKLTTALAWPVLAWLAWVGGRRTAVRALAGLAGGLLAVGVWGYVVNLAQTGQLLGHGGGRTEVTVSPTVVGTIHTTAHVFYRVFDLSVLSNRLVGLLAAVGLAAGLAVALATRRRSGGRGAGLTGAAVAVPFLAPLLVLAGGAVFAWLARVLDIPVQSTRWEVDRSLNRAANEDESAFGPLGTVALIAAPLLAVAAYATRRADLRQLVFALAFPSYLVLFAVNAEYNIFATRFLLVPVALTAPLFARFFHVRAVAAAIAVVAAIVAGMTLAHNKAKPLGGPLGRPWQLTQNQALVESFEDYIGPALAGALNRSGRLVPPGACVGAVLDPDEPSYLLWGPELARRVYFLPSLDALGAAQERGLDYVFVSTGVNAPVADQFEAGGWTVRRLGYWQLATTPGAGAGDCKPS